MNAQRAHVELYIRHLTDQGLMPSSVTRMLHGVRGYFRYAHIDGLIPSDPAVYARLPTVHRDESRTQGLDRLELIRFPSKWPRSSVSTTARWSTCSASPRCVPPKPQRYGSRTTPKRCAGTACCTWSAKTRSPPPSPLTVPVLRVLEACRGERTAGPLILRPHSGNPIDPGDAYRMVLRITKLAGIDRRISPHSLRHAAIINASASAIP